MVKKDFEERPNFFLGSTNNTPSPQILQDSTKDKSSSTDSGFKEIQENNRCCENNCRNRKTSIISNYNSEKLKNENEKEIGNVILNEEPKKQRLFFYHKNQKKKI